MPFPSGLLVMSASSPSAFSAYRRINLDSGGPLLEATLAKNPAYASLAGHGPAGEDLSNGLFSQLRSPLKSLG